MELQELFNRIKNDDPEAKELIRKKALEFEAQNAPTGPEGRVPEEAPIEEDEITNAAVDTAVMGPPKLLQKVGSFAGSQAVKQGTKKLEKLNMPQAGMEKPHFSEAPGEKSVTKFAEFIRPEKGSPEIARTAIEKKPAGTEDLGQYWTKWKSKPMKETQASTGFKDVKSPVGNIYVNPKLK